MPASKQPHQLRFSAVTFAVVAAVLLGVGGSLAAFNGPLSALSFVCAAIALVVPQFIVFSIISKKSEQDSMAMAHRAFYFWSLKFSLSILLMVLILRGLHESGLLQAPSFIAGTIIGIVLNIIWTARFPFAVRKVQSESVSHGR